MSATIQHGERVATVYGGVWSGDEALSTIAVLATIDEAPGPEEPNADKYLADVAAAVLGASVIAFDLLPEAELGSVH